MAETTFALTLPDAVILVAETVVAEIAGVWIFVATKILVAETVVAEIAGVWIFVVAWILVAETVVPLMELPRMLVAESVGV